MSSLTVFKNQDFGEVRTILIDDEPYFVGKDVAEILGYERATKAIRDHVDGDDIHEVPIQDSIGRMQSTPIVNESGLYSLILSSKLPTAKRFKKWVTSEVLPQIRKTGKYSYTPKSYAEALRLYADEVEQKEAYAKTKRRGNTHQGMDIWQKDSNNHEHCKPKIEGSGEIENRTRPI